MKTREEFINSMCLTWDHSFLAPRQEVFEGFTFGLTDEQKQHIWNNMSQVYDNDVAPFINQHKSIIDTTINISESINNAFKSITLLYFFYTLSDFS